MLNPGKKLYKVISSETEESGALGRSSHVKLSRSVD